MPMQAEKGPGQPGDYIFAVSPETKELLLAYADKVIANSKDGVAIHLAKNVREVVGGHGGSPWAPDEDCTSPCGGLGCGDAECKGASSGLTHEERSSMGASAITYEELQERLLSTAALAWEKGATPGVSSGGPLPLDHGCENRIAIHMMNDGIRRVSVLVGTPHASVLLKSATGPSWDICLRGLIHSLAHDIVTKLDDELVVARQEQEIIKKIIEGV